jgi:hypothetical protein
MSDPKIRIYFNDTRSYRSGIIERDSGKPVDALAEMFPYDWRDFVEAYGPEFSEDMGREFETPYELDEWVNDVHFYDFASHLSESLVTTDVLKG